MFELVPFRKNNTGISKRGDYFEDMMANFFGDTFFSPMFSEGSFKVDLKENENEYLVEADLPGVKKDDIDIDYNLNYLTISAKKESSSEENDKNNGYIRRERHYGEFKRSFYIDNVNEDNIHAEFQDGVLKLVLPKETHSKKNKKKIEIH